MNEPAMNYQEEIKKCKTMEDVLGKNGLMQRLLKDVIQNLLEAEMAEHLGREKYERHDEPADNYRNGYNEKTIRSSLGEMDIEVPRDRKGEFEPIAVKKYQTNCNELDKKVIAMYARGMTTRDIKTQLEELYGIDVSPSMVSAREAWGRFFCFLIHQLQTNQGFEGSQPFRAFPYLPRVTNYSNLYYKL